MVVTGPGGSGRSTAINALEDMGYEAIDNLPISLLTRLFSDPVVSRPLVVGIDPRNRDFAVEGLFEALAEVESRTGKAPVLTYLDCDADTLIQRYSETRRRHPMSPDGDPKTGIDREIALLEPLRLAADVLIRTGPLNVHELRAEIVRQFQAEENGNALVVNLQSFSYRRGVPRGADMVIDVRFLRNPHYVMELRPRTGLEKTIQQFVQEDRAFDPFYTRLLDLVLFLLPAYQREGKSYFSIGFGCTGGKHRSVSVTEMFAASLAREGWSVSARHRDLERLGAGQPDREVVE
ncbi:RNase adapter RapZ [Amaricoccus tamworthensis]|uniref:RNase adapter RapZ n=1 Tax=Amaricoccus tamworthensis TaxID=57002 RepID=UPI003C79A3D0